MSDEDNSLKGPVPNTVYVNQSPPTGQRVLLEVDGLIHEYSHDEDLFIVERLLKKMRAEVGWFENITNHGPSVGSFYEFLVKSTLIDVLPSSIRLGTGFIYDSKKRSVSTQIDLILYRDLENAPIYRRDDFVIVDSDQVISCIEVKKTLTASELRKLISKTINLNFGTSTHAISGIQFLNIFAFYSKLSVKSVQKIVIDELKRHLSKFHTKQFQEIMHLF